jgi:glycosyltransferase involved in cell wall biosynthesis
MKRKFCVWIPNIFDFKGGIQIHSAFLLKALEGLYPEVEYHAFLKHDRQVSDDVSQFPRTHFHFFGKFPLLLRTGFFSVKIVLQALIHRPDLILSTHLNFILAAYWIKRLIGTPYWVIAHGVEAWDIQRLDLRVALQSADRILCVSNYTRDRLVKEQALDPDKVGLLSNTFDASRFQIAPKPIALLERHQLKPEQPIILTVSRLASSEQYKGYDKLLIAVSQIRQTIPNVHYIIVGKGDDRARIEQMIADLNVQDCVTLVGLIPDEELCSYYNLCDIFAMPSKGEGFGIVYLEAIACGKPTLAGNQDGSVDALAQGKLGALVNPDDTDEISQTLIHMLQKTYPNPLIYQPEHLRQMVIELFGFEQFEQTLQSQLEHFFFSIH